MDLLDLGKSPISPEAPSGTEVRETDRFLELQSEVNRSQSMSSSASIDWKKVRNLSTDILGSMGKDLLVAAYLSVALSKTEGPPGFVAGLSVMNDLVREYWETLYPPLKRIRARRNAISWWLEQMQEILPELSDPPLAPDNLSRANGILRELNGILGEKDPEGPMLNVLYPLVQGLPAIVPEPDVTEESVPVKVEASPPPGAKGVGEILPSLDGDPEETLERLLEILRKVASSLGEASPPDPRVFRYVRMTVWEPIRGLPDSQSRITRVPPPPPHLLERLHILKSNGLPEERIMFAEAQQAEFPFWFELSFESACAMELLGPAWAAAREAIVTELRFFGARLPGIFELAFSDETPFLSDPGREWLGASMQGNAGEGGAGGTSRDPIAPVRNLLGEREAEKAVQTLETLRRHASTVQDRFQLDLEFLSLVRDMGRDFPVLSLAQGLLVELDRHHLDVWDPPLAAKALAQIHRALFDSEDPDDRKMADGALRRLLKIDLPGGMEVFRSRR